MLSILSEGRPTSSPCAAHLGSTALLEPRRPLRPSLHLQRWRRCSGGQLAAGLHQPHLLHFAPVLRHALRPRQLVVCGLRHGGRAAAGGGSGGGTAVNARGCAWSSVPAWFRLYCSRMSVCLRHQLGGQLRAAGSWAAARPNGKTDAILVPGEILRGVLGPALSGGKASKGFPCSQPRPPHRPAMLLAAIAEQPNLLSERPGRLVGSSRFQRARRLPLLGALPVAAGASSPHKDLHRTASSGSQASAAQPSRDARPSRSFV